MQIKEASMFPVISRTGRTSAELQLIIDTISLSSKSGQPYSIEGIQAGKKYNSMQQRIRAQAKKMGLDVSIHFDKSNETLYFKVNNTSEFETTIAPKGSVSNSSDIDNVKTVTRKRK